MTQDISRKRFLLIFLLILSLSCKEEKSRANEAQLRGTQNELNLIGTWYCSGFAKENRINPNYGESFAKENAKYSYFKIENDSIFFGGCSEKIYKYSYSLENEQYSDERVFVTHFKPQKKAVDFFTTDNVDPCLPIETPIFFIKGANEVVILDRGYFFSYKKEQKNTPYFSVIGIPGNNRGYWEVNGVYEDSNLKSAYGSFLSEFEYGGENLLKIPPAESFIDKQNAIEYLIEQDSLIIEKSDPMGTIYISFKKNGNDMNFKYQLNYPEW